jgi:hypothetical protein
MKRLDTERQQRLEPERMAHARDYLTSMGYHIDYMDKTRIEFAFDGHKVQYYPYSGWHTGKSIADGRGWKKLYEQIKPI